MDSNFISMKRGKRKREFSYRVVLVRNIPRRYLLLIVEMRLTSILQEQLLCDDRDVAVTWDSEELQAELEGSERPRDAEDHNSPQGQE